MTIDPGRTPTLDRFQPWHAHGVHLVSMHRETSDVWTYELTFDDPETAAGYRFLPGQFNMLYLPGIGEAAISISSDADHSPPLLHSVRVVGNVTKALSRLEIGDPLMLRGPFASAWPIDACQGKNMIIAAGGVGLAPLRSVIYHILNRRDRFRRVHLLYGARTPADLLYADEFDQWRAGGIEVEVTVDLGNEDWTGNIGVVPTLFSRLLLDAAQTRVFTCGPEIMMRFVVYECLSRKIAPADIYVSLERNMNCAVGLCGHCQLGPAFVCKDGPVFGYDTMERYLDIDQF